MRKVVVLAALLSLLPGIAAAAKQERSPADRIRDHLQWFGFAGEWAVDCKKPASPENPHRLIMIEPQGKAGFTETIGDKFKSNSYEIVDTQRHAPAHLRARIRLNGEIVQDLTFMRKGGMVRTMTNRRVPEDEVIVRNGIVLKSQASTPWLTRCDEKFETKPLDQVYRH